MDDPHTAQECRECRSFEVSHLIVRCGSAEPGGLG